MGEPALEPLDRGSQRVSKRASHDTLSKAAKGMAGLRWLRPTEPVELSSRMLGGLLNESVDEPCSGHGVGQVKNPFLASRSTA